MRSRESRLRARAYRASRRRGPSLPEDRIRPMRTLRFALISVILAAAVVVPSLAAAATTPIATTPAPVPTTTTPAPTPPPPPPAPAAGKIDLVIQHAFGKPPFVVAGSRMVVRGIVIPYVAEQKVKVSFYQRRAQGRSEDGQRAAAGQRRGPVPHRLRELQRRSRAGRARCTTPRRSRRRSPGARKTCASPHPTCPAAIAAPPCACCSPS